MILRLLLKGPARLMGADHERIVETGSLTIGRSPDADWPLPDPERLISKAHCRIDKNEHGFVVTDISTNGLQINDRPVTRGMAHPLADGDILRLGDGVIAVSIQAPTQPVVAADATPGPVARRVDPFMEGPFGFDDMAASSAETAALPQPEATPGDVKVQTLQDWWNPTSATDKLTVPVNRDILTSATEAQAAQADNGAGDVESIFKAAEGVDSKILVRSVGMAILVLSEQQREVFTKRLCDLLREEMARWK
jgi:type VI secretion system FHA domain protein